MKLKTRPLSPLGMLLRAYLHIRKSNMAVLSKVQNPLMDFILSYSKTCVKRSLKKKTKQILYDKW